MSRISRRSRFGAAAVTSALFGLGSVFVLAAGPNAHADGFTCRASAVRVTGKGALSSLDVEPIVANDGNSPCVANAPTPGVTVNLPTGAGDHVSVLAVATTDDENSGPGNPNSASASARIVEVQLGGTLLRAQVLTSDASETQNGGRCVDGSFQPGDDQPTRTGDAHVAHVVLNGTSIEVPTAKTDHEHPTASVPGVLDLFLREEIASPDTLTERALELDTPLVNIVVAESQVGGTSPAADQECPTITSETTASTGPTTSSSSSSSTSSSSTTSSSTTTTEARCEGPETDPFVDPTDDDTKGLHPDCAEFSPPAGEGEDFVHFVRSIEDSDESPNGAFEPVSTEDSRDRFNGKAGFFEAGDTMPSIEGDFYDDDDMHFRLEPLTIDAYFAPEDNANSPWRRFCGTGEIMPFQSISGGPGDAMPSAPFETGQVRKFLVETFDAKTLDPTNPGGDQSDYWVIDIYAPGSDFDTQQCDPAPMNHDHGEETNPFRDSLDYHSEGQTEAGNIEIHSARTTMM